MPCRRPCPASHLHPPFPPAHAAFFSTSAFGSSTFGSGSEWDWPQSPGGGQYESADYGATFGALGDAAGGYGGAPAGGPGGADAGFFGGSDFFALQSDDWTDDFVSEVRSAFLLC